MAEDAKPGTQATDATLKRRGILAAAGAVIAGIVAKQTAQPVAASTAMLIANTETAGVSNSVVGPSTIAATSSFTSPNAVFIADASLAPLTSALAALHGAATTPAAAPEICGVFGQGGPGSGVIGTASVTGKAAVRGIGTGSASGVQGESDAVGAIGVIGASSAGVGVKGAATTGFPIVGQVVDPASINAGVLGMGTAGPGGQGQSTGGHGLVGTTFATDGVHAALIGSVQPGSNAIAVRGSVQPGSVGYAGLFHGDVIINGALQVFGAPKNAAVKHPDGSHRLLYCLESPESWFEDFGESTLAGGRAEITLDVDFAALVHIDKYHIFLTPEGPLHLYVAQKSPTGFTVVGAPLASAGGGLARPEVAAGTFSWRVVAKRKDIAGERLAKVAPPPPLKPVTPFVVPEPPTAKPPVQPSRATRGGQP